MKDFRLRAFYRSVSEEMLYINVASAFILTILEARHPFIIKHAENTVCNDARHTAEEACSDS